MEGFDNIQARREAQARKRVHGHGPVASTTSSGVFAPSTSASFQPGPPISSSMAFSSGGPTTSTTPTVLPPHNSSTTPTANAPVWQPMSRTSSGGGGAFAPSNTAGTGLSSAGLQQQQQLQQRPVSNEFGQRGGSRNVSGGGHSVDSRTSSLSDCEVAQDDRQGFGSSANNSLNRQQQQQSYQPQPQQGQQQQFRPTFQPQQGQPAFGGTISSTVAPPIWGASQPQYQQRQTTMTGQQQQQRSGVFPSAQQPQPQQTIPGSGVFPPSTASSQQPSAVSSAKQTPVKDKGLPSSNNYGSGSGDSIDSLEAEELPMGSVSPMQPPGGKGGSKGKDSAIPKYQDMSAEEEGLHGKEKRKNNNRNKSGGGEEYSDEDVDVPKVRDFFELIHSPPRNGLIQCYIIRDRSNFTLGTRYCFFSEKGDQFLLSSRKRMSTATADYLLSKDPMDMSRDSEHYIGKTKSSFTGSEWVMYDNGERLGSQRAGKELRRELGIILYVPNHEKGGSSHKKVVVLPVRKQGNEMETFAPTCDAEGILAEYRRNPKSPRLHVLESKQPSWNEGTRSFQMNFFGRVTKSSVKNFQLYDTRNPQSIAMLFGRVDEDKFVLDFQYPLSGLQAFAVALSVFDNKICCK